MQNAAARRFRVQLVLSFAICAVAIYAVYFPLRDAWTVNRASVLVNRAIVQKQSRSQAATNSDVAKAMSLIDAATSRGTHSTFREAPMWRVYGAAASVSPSETSLKKLAEASDAGLMDHFGVLSLGEVATSMGHWAEAEKAFTKIDASNLLIDRADKSFEANRKQQAIHEYLLAKESLDAASKRAAASGGATGFASLTSASLSQQPGEKATFLFKIGRGILHAGDAKVSVPILAESLDSAKEHSPGTAMMQSICLTLAEALAKTLPATDQSVSAAGSVDYYALGSSQYANLQTNTRARALARQGVKLGVSSSSCLGAARTLLMLGDDTEAVLLLQQALDLDPRNVDAYVILGDRDERLGMYVTARQLYKKGLQFLPSNARLMNVYAVSCYETLPAKEAAPNLKRAIDLGAKNPYLYAYLGDCYAEMGMTTEARSVYTAGLHKYPDAQYLSERLSRMGAAGSNGNARS